MEPATKVRPRPWPIRVLLFFVRWSAACAFMAGLFVLIVWPLGLDVLTAAVLGPAFTFVGGAFVFILERTQRRQRRTWAASMRARLRAYGGRRP